MTWIHLLNLMRIEDKILLIRFLLGSTGEPKGVQIRYDSLNQFTQ